MVADFSNHLEFNGLIIEAKSITIHGGTIERRHVFRRRDRLAKHAVQ
jgi:hypothetical protein